MRLIVLFLSMVILTVPAFSQNLRLVYGCISIKSVDGKVTDYRYPPRTDVSFNMKKDRIKSSKEFSLSINDEIHNYRECSDYCLFKDLKEELSNPKSSNYVDYCTTRKSYGGRNGGIKKGDDLDLLFLQDKHFVSADCIAENEPLCLAVENKTDEVRYSVILCEDEDGWKNITTMLAKGNALIMLTSRDFFRLSGELLIKNVRQFAVIYRKDRFLEEEVDEVLATYNGKEDIKISSELFEKKFEIQLIK